MADKTYTLSIDQLSELVADAVNNALQKLDNITVVDTSASPGSDIPIGDFSPEQREAAMQAMRVNRGSGDEPKVGIFWYNATLKDLFGVVTHKRTDYLRPNAGGGLITCSEMQEDVWKKAYRKQKYHHGGIGPFKGEYQNKPRGRVFYSPSADQYIIAVGSWIEHSPEAIGQVMEEFDLPRSKTVIQKDTHWDIGQTWRD